MSPADLLMTGIVTVPETRWKRRLLALVAGLLVCFAMPPWGWWPLAPLGIACWALLLEHRPWRARFRVGVLVGFGWYLPSTLWMVTFSPAGWPLGVAVWFPFVLGVVSALCPPRATLVALPGMVVLGEWFRWHAPFGGVPLSMLAYAQARGPFLPVARVAGTLGVSGAVAVTGVGVAAALSATGRRRVTGMATIAAVIVVAGAGIAAPRGEAIREIEVATVQGGGEQQTRSDATDYSQVLDRHLTAALKIDEPVDLVVFPENITNISGFYRGSFEEERIAEVARLLDATVVAGIVEDHNDPDHFWNFAVAVGPDGRSEDRYDKVRRVPYGEYVPMRNLLEPIAEGVLPPRDDREGTGPAVLDTRLTRLGVVISWETFFPRRAADAVNHGATILLNPTNGSSYWLTQVQTQQIASSTLRAVETGRWMLQSAPTGFSAIIDPSGDVLLRSGMREQRVLQDRVELRRGTTIAMTLGESPVLAVSALVLALAWWLCRRVESPRSSAPTQIGAPDGESRNDSTDHEIASSPARERPLAPED